MTTDNNDPKAILAHLPREALRGLRELDLQTYFQEHARYNGGVGEPGQQYCIFADDQYLWASNLTQLLKAFRKWVRQGAIERRLAS